MPRNHPPPETTASLGQRIAWHRIRRMLSQGTLAQALGVTRSAVAQWETDRARPLHQHTAALARHLHVNIEQLFPTKETPTMTFAVRNLSVLAYANGFTLWHYKAGDGGLFNARRVGFFNDAADMMAVGDMILVSGVDGGAVIVVATAGGGRVLTAPMVGERLPEREPVAAE